MTPPIQLERLPKRSKNPFKKPAFQRVFFWVALTAIFAIFAAGLYARLTT